jgi:competence protein ComEC
MVCDLGSNPLYDLVQWTAGPLLARDRIAHIDAVMVSHPNLDHYSSIPDLAERRWFDELIVSPYFTEPGPSAPGARKLLARVGQLGIPLRTLSRGDRFEGTGGAITEVLWPPGKGWKPAADPNDASIVLSVSWAGRRILLCGDLGPESQMALIASTDLKADVLVLPHHGKVEPTTPALLRAVDPKICIRSSGRRDPSQQEGIRALMTGRAYLNTADVGAVRVDLSPGGVRAYRGANDNRVESMAGN